MSELLYFTISIHHSSQYSEQKEKMRRFMFTITWKQEIKQHDPKGYLPCWWCLLFQQWILTKKGIYWFLKVEVYPNFEIICCISIYWKLSFILSQTIAPNLNSFVGFQYPQTKPFYEFRNELDIVCSKNWWEIFVETGLPYFYHPKVTRDISCRKLPAEKRCKKITNFNELNECGVSVTQMLR